MIKYTDEHGTKIEVVFRHVYPAKHRPYTTCNILMDGDLEALGISECSKHDNFNHNTGRKVALTRALRDGFWMAKYKEFRTTIWKKYFEARNGKKD